MWKVRGKDVGSGSMACVICSILECDERVGIRCPNLVCLFSWCHGVEFDVK